MKYFKQIKYNYCTYDFNLTIFLGSPTNNSNFAISVEHKHSTLEILPQKCDILSKKYIRNALPCFGMGRSYPVLGCMQHSDVSKPHIHCRQGYRADTTLAVYTWASRSHPTKQQCMEIYFWENNIDFTFASRLRLLYIKCVIYAFCFSLINLFQKKQHITDMVLELKWWYLQTRMTCTALGMVYYFITLLF